MTPEHKEFLDAFREQGMVNMMLGPKLLQEGFGVSVLESHTIFSEWMKSFRKEK